MSLPPVEDALAQILAGMRPVESEIVALHLGYGRVLAGDLAARRTQPGVRSSAMDGYAVRSQDLAPNASFAVIGTAAAGQAFKGHIGATQAVRIFTGAPVPDGADTVVIQEHVETLAEKKIALTVSPASGANIRPVGLDFKEGQVLLRAGIKLGPRDIALAGAMNHAVLPLRRRPKIAILSTGDELQAPGAVLGANHTTASNAFAIAGIVQAEGADALDLGIAPDNRDSLIDRIRKAETESADVLVTIGGASVGERDLVQAALQAAGVDIGLWKVAMRPGKPMLHGRKGSLHVLGLPGNPGSAFVCAVVFLAPLIRALLGRAEARLPLRPAQWAVDWKANDSRQDYIRARLARDEAGCAHVLPLSLQDSSMSAVLQQADCLIVRPPFAPAAKESEACQIIDLGAAGY